MCAWLTESTLCPARPDHRRYPCRLRARGGLCQRGPWIVAYMMQSLCGVAAARSLEITTGKGRQGRNQGHHHLRQTSTLFKKQIPSGCTGGQSCRAALSTDIWPPPVGRPASPGGRTGLTTRPPPWAPAPHHQAPDHHTTALVRPHKPQKTNREIFTLSNYTFHENTDFMNSVKFSHMQP